MEFGQHQLQVFVSVVVIVAAAAVALICDFLKRNNDQLRELTIELKVRREEEQKLSQLLTPRTAAAVPVPAVLAAATPAPNGKQPAAAKQKKRTNADALAAMERGAALAGSGGRPRSAAPAPIIERTPEVEVIAAKPAAKFSVPKKDWSSLLNRNAMAQAERQPATVAAPSTVEASLPAGFHDGFVLHNLVKNHQPVSGLVVSIGVNASRKSSGGLPEAVHQLLQSLIGPNDFAAQSAEDEFLLIYPQERGASAQRRLSQIAQKLWDFQLRSLGSFQILFSWGGVEVRSESIEEAIASASERMQETKRARKLLTMAPAAGEMQFRQAV